MTDPSNEELAEMLDYYASNQRVALSAGISSPAAFRLAAQRLRELDECERNLAELVSRIGQLPTPPEQTP